MAFYFIKQSLNDAVNLNLFDKILLHVQIEIKSLVINNKYLLLNF